MTARRRARTTTLAPICPGAVGDIVTAVQAALGVPETRHYDKTTRAAVEQFQADAGLAVTGVFTEAEAAALRAL